MKVCECFDKIRKDAEKVFNVDYVHFRSIGYIEIGITGTGKNGKKSKKTTFHRRNWEFCPLCGKKIVGENDE